MRIPAAGLSIVATTAIALAGGTPDAIAAGVDYGPAVARCSVDDPRLAQMSGVATIGGRLFVVNDTGPVTVFALDAGCRVSATWRLKIPAPNDPNARAVAPTPTPKPRRRLPVTVPRTTDVEDVAAAPDGSLWLADIGGDATQRGIVSLYRWPGKGWDARRYDLRYPDGPHDAEALLISLTGQAVIVTKAVDGRSGVYTAPLPIPPAATLTKVADLDTRGVTGGAVSPDGVHLVLRTQSAAYEWDAPDGDVVSALRSGTPRTVEIGRDRAGEGIAYSPDGRRLLLTGATLPARVSELAITRPAGTAQQANPTVSRGVLLGLGAALVLGIGVALLGRDRRRWAARATTYESGA